MNKRQGLYTVLAAIAIQLTVGISYLWSLFQTGIANSIFAGNNAAAGLTFSLLLSMLAVGGVISGKLASKISIRAIIFIGGILIAIGFLLASFVTPENPWILWVSYGVFGGVGMGFTYSTCIAVAQKWYPHKKGFVTGIIVASLGFGGLIFTPLIEMLIENFGGTGVGERKTFMVLSVIFLVVCSVGSIFMKTPPANYMVDDTKTTDTSPTVKNYTPIEMIKTPQFYLVIAAFTLGCMSGLMLIGFAKPIAVARGLVETATIGVLAISLFNAAGRIVWGMVSDKLGRTNTILILLAGSTVFSLFVLSVDGYWIYVFIALVGFCYGGLLSTFPALTSDIFGPKNMATNYGIVLCGFGAAAILGSQIGGYFKNVAACDINLMFPAFVIVSCCAVVAIGMILILKKKIAKSNSIKN